MPDEEESFKVTDRRGRAGDEGRVEGAPAGRAQPPASPSPPGAGAPASVEGEESEGVTDLRGLFAMLATSALIGLGEAIDPEMGGEIRVDLNQAREAIDVLLLLREKTSGNRTARESEFLDQVLYDLQVRFVRASEAKRPR